MADKAIADLDFAPGSVDDSNTLFVVSQSGVAYKLSGAAFYSAMAAMYNAHGSIKTVEKITVNEYSTSGSTDYSTGDLCRHSNAVYQCTGTTTGGSWDSTKWTKLFDATVLTDVYCITFGDNHKEYFPITNGRSITSISWVDSGTAGDGQTHTGTISYNDGTTTTVVFTDGVKGDTGDQTYVHIKYADDEPTSDMDMGDEPDAWMGIYAGTEADAAELHYTDFEWYKIKGEQGNTGNTGNGISNISGPSTVGLIDTYTIIMTNGNTSSFNVKNGKSISSVTPPQNPGLPGATDIYTINYNDGDTSVFYVYNGTNGEGSVSTVDGISPSNGNVPLLIFGTGAPTTSTVGVVKQRYFDTENNMLYVCTSVSGSTYTWKASSVTVDSALSSSSTNPVQNKVLYGIIGSESMGTTATTIKGAIAEHENDISGISSSATNKVLYFTSVTCSATTGDFASVSNAAITANHVVVSCEFANPKAVGDVAWTTASGSLTLNGTCSTATTVNITLIKKDN